LLIRRASQLPRPVLEAAGPLAGRREPRTDLFERVLGAHPIPESRARHVAYHGNGRNSTAATALSRFN
jgi:hypothetical protein